MADDQPLQSKDDSGSDLSSLLPTTEKVEKLESKLGGLLQDRIGLEQSFVSSQDRKDRRNEGIMQQMINAQGAEIGHMQPWNEQTMAPPPTNLWEKFGSPGFVIGMLASAFTAMPMSSALNAGAAAMNAINAGDMQRHNDAFAAWKQNTELAFKRHELEHTELEEIRDLMKEDRTSAQAKLKALLSKNDDQRKQAFLNAGMDDEIWKAYDAEHKSVLDAQHASLEIIRNNARMKAIQETPEFQNGDHAGLLKRLYEFELLGGGGDKDTVKRQQEAQEAEAYTKEITASPGDYWALSDSERFRVHSLIAHYQPDFQYPPRPGPNDPPPGMDHEQFDMAGMQSMLGMPPPAVGSRGGNAAYQRQQVYNHGLQMASDMGLSAGDIVARKANLKAQTTNLSRLQALNSAISAWSETESRNGRVLAALARKVDSKTGSPILEGWIRAGKKAVEGDPDVTAFDAQINAYRDGVARILRNPTLTSGGVVTKDARKEAESFLAGNFTADQIDAVTNLFDQDFERRKGPLRDEIRNVLDDIRGNMTAKAPESLPPEEETVKWEGPDGVTHTYKRDPNGGDPILVK